MTVHTLKKFEGVQSGKTARAVHLTTTASDLKQTLTTNNIAQTVTLTAHQHTNVDIPIDLGTGVCTFNTTGGVLLSASFQVIREVGGGGNAYWICFVETSLDNGSTWNPYPGSARRTTLSSQDVDDIKLVDYTIAIKGVIGEKFRFRHVTTNVSKTISIVSQAATGGAPASAGVILSALSVSDN